MEVTIISDTHFQHQKVNLLGGEMLIHCGDICKFGKEEEVIDFLKWFEIQDYKHKIFIAGNHDWFFEKADKKYIESLIPKNIHYLNDSGVEIEGIKIWGSPIQPTFFNWAFNRKRGSAINKHWELIPRDTNILITHGPAYGILDKTQNGHHVGCEMLLEKVLDIKPKIHAFGHIHEGYGIEKNLHTTFVNASLANINYQIVNLPVIVKI